MSFICHIHNYTEYNELHLSLSLSLSLSEKLVQALWEKISLNQRWLYLDEFWSLEGIFTLTLKRLGEENRCGWCFDFWN